MLQKSDAECTFYTQKSGKFVESFVQNESNKENMVKLSKSAI